MGNWGSHSFVARGRNIGLGSVYCLLEKRVSWLHMISKEYDCVGAGAKDGDATERQKKV